MKETIRNKLYDLYRYGYAFAAVVGAVILASGLLLTKSFLGRQGLLAAGSFKPILSLILTLFLFIWYVYFSRFFVRARKYRIVTRRSLREDRLTYKRTFWQLFTYFRDAEPFRLDEFSFPRATWKKKNGIFFGMAGGRLIFIPSKSECNISVFGPPGSGKTTGMLIPAAMQFEGSVFAIDIKGDIYNFVSEHTDRKILRFCPDSPNPLRDSVRIDIFHGLGKMDDTEKKLYLERTAIILIEEGQGDAGKYFSDTGRKFFQGVYFILEAERGSISFPELTREILINNASHWVELSNAPGAPIEAVELLASLEGTNEKNLSGAYDAVTSVCRRFSNDILNVLLDHSENSITPDVLEKGEFDLYLQISQSNLKVYAPIFTLICEMFSSYFTNRADSSTREGKNNTPILMALDEFPQLTYSYDLINSNLSTLRSKNVIIMLIQQSRAQLEKKYSPEGARVILGNCNYQVILGCNDANVDGRAFSSMFGEKKVLKLSTSLGDSKGGTSGNISVNEAKEPVFEPQYFGILPELNKEIVYFKGRYIETTKIKCYE